MANVFDTAVVGAGILGLAHAYQLARRGHRVIVFERRPRAEGASVRNFGMLWPIGQPAGEMYRLARRSLEHWQTILQASALWHEQAGSLHLAYRDDEAQVLREFVSDPCNEEFGCQLFDPDQVRARSPWVRSDGLRLALWSPIETCVDPRQVLAGLPDWLHKTYSVEFAFGRAVIDYDLPIVRTATGTTHANRLIVCSGDEFQGLYPEVFAASGLVRCKLQMMRSRPYGPHQRLGPMLAAGLTLRHYKAFAHCPTLPTLEERVAAEYPDYVKYGIHVLAAQNGQGEVCIGDSHEYGDAIEPFDKAEVDDLILTYLHTFLALPDLHIASRWHGTYAKTPDTAIRGGEPSGKRHGGRRRRRGGMTLAFGLAERVVSGLLGDS